MESKLRVAERKNLDGETRMGVALCSTDWWNVKKRKYGVKLCRKGEKREIPEPILIKKEK